MLKTSLPRIEISVASTNEIVSRSYKKNHVIFIGSFKENENFRLTQRYHKQNNNSVHNSQIYHRRVKIATRKFIRPFPDAIVNNELAFWTSGSTIITKRTYSDFCSITSSHWKRAQSCENYCTMGRLFFAFKVTNDWPPDRLVPYIRKMPPVPLQ